MILMARRFSADNPNQCFKYQIVAQSSWLKKDCSRIVDSDFTKTKNKKQLIVGY